MENNTNLKKSVKNKKNRYEFRKIEKWPKSVTGIFCEALPIETYVLICPRKYNIVIAIEEDS